MNRRLAARLLVAAIGTAGAIVAFVGGCERSLDAIIVSAPAQVRVGDTAVFQVSTDWSHTDPLFIRYVIDWGEDTAETTASHFPADSTVSFAHAWRVSGVYHVRVEPDRESGQDKDGKHKSINYAGPDEQDITVTGTGNAAPILDLTGPGYTSVDAVFRLLVFAWDPDGDSLTVDIDWGDSHDTTSSFCKSPCTLEFTHVYTRIETVYVEATGTDSKKAKSAVPETLQVQIGAAGGVMAFWWNNDEDRGSITTSLLYLPDGTEDHVWGGCEDDYKFYGIETRRMRSSHSGTTRFAENVFTGHPGYCAATSHIIVGSDEGELYALKLNSLSEEWRYPGKTREESLTGIEWGAPAINGNKLYVGHDDDSIFYLLDNGPTVTCMSAWYIGASMVGAPVVDAAGAVYLGNDSGYLCKLSDSLQPVWRARLQANGEIHSPVVDDDGTVYCTSDSNRLYAVNADNGQVRWVAPLVGEATRPAVGTGGIFTGTSSGRFYRFDKTSGAVIWERQLGTTEFATTPLIAANGYLYAQNDVDKLYCVRQSDGDTVWVCDCPQSLPRDRRARMMQLVDYAPNPTLAPDGNIYIAGSDALYKVKGYAEGPLDPAAPWPKWQHDLYNTGYVNGGH